MLCKYNTLSYVYIDKNWILHLYGNTTCSNMPFNMIISTQGVNEITCEDKASNHPDAKFMFWSSVSKKNGQFQKSRCELFRECNLKKNNDSPGSTYRLKEGEYYANIRVKFVLKWN